MTDERYAEIAFGVTVFAIGLAIAFGTYVLRRAVRPGEMRYTGVWRLLGCAFTVLAIALLLFGQYGGQPDIWGVGMVISAGCLCAIFALPSFAVALSVHGHFDDEQITVGKKTGRWDELEWFNKPKGELGGAFLLGFRDGTVIPMNWSVSNFQVVADRLEEIRQQRPIEDRSTWMLSDADVAGTARPRYRKSDDD